MPAYLYPGVYVEEVSFRNKAIDGVSTTTTGFVGSARQGPIGKSSDGLTSFAEFVQGYGDTGAIGGQTNFLARSVQAFFENGGRRIFVVRVPDKPSRKDYQTALEALRKIGEISIVAAPGHAEVDAEVSDLLVQHAEKTRARIAVLETAAGLTVDQALEYKSKFNSSFAALYYPWVTTANGVSLPPTGFVCGIYVRTDTERGVQKAPANQVAQGAAGLERALNEADSERLNNANVNVLRQFPGRGILVWGARTCSPDGEWKYVNVRRLLVYIEQSIAQGTRWVVFEPNEEALWITIRGSIEQFLAIQWRNGALIGDKPDEAFFVRCGRDTMTQDDIDHGRIVCLVGVASVKPAEFIILRIRYQKTRRRTK